MRPSIALPTGPYDWHPERIPRATFEARLEQMRAVMAAHGVTHAIVHGNGFDHAALWWLTHLTPKLGPAYALVPACGDVRVLFSGGPGMKPSAQRLTWVGDVTALKAIGRDIEAWIAATRQDEGLRLGLVEGAAMLRGDWDAIAGRGDVVPLDDPLAACMRLDACDTKGLTVALSETLRLVERTLAGLVRRGTDLRMIMLGVEKAAYAAGAEDVRTLISRTPDGAPTTPPDEPTPMLAPTRFLFFVRQRGVWGEVYAQHTAKD